MPMTQLTSRGRRNAPVKNVRNMWIVSASMNSSADQWCTWRTNRPPRTSNVMYSVDSYARDISRPRRLSNEPW